MPARDGPFRLAIAFLATICVYEVIAQKVAVPVHVSAGMYLTCATMYGNMECWGFESGSLPPVINFGENKTVVQVAGGSGHYCAMLDDGKLKCWGTNSWGELGTGTNVNSLNMTGANMTAVSLGTGKFALQVACGAYHTCAVLNDHTLKCWGNNASGQLGGLRGLNVPQQLSWGMQPAQMGDGLPTVNIGGNHMIRQVTAGSSHTCAILDDGSVKCWGFNSNGELGLGDTSNRGDVSSSNDSVGSLEQEMGDALPAVDLGTGHTALQISSRCDFTCALLDDGNIKCWGLNGSGQLGTGDKTNRGDRAGQMGDALPAVPLGTGRHAVSVSVGCDHACAVLDDGTLKCWGASSHGELGLEDSMTRGDEPTDMGDNLPVVNVGAGRTVLQVVTGAKHTCALLDNLAVKCWGSNRYDQLRMDPAVPMWGAAHGQMGDALPAVPLRMQPPPAPRRPPAPRGPAPGSTPAAALPAAGSRSPNIMVAVWVPVATVAAALLVLVTVFGYRRMVAQRVVSAHVDVGQEMHVKNVKQLGNEVELDGVPEAMRTRNNPLYVI